MKTSSDPIGARTIKKQKLCVFVCEDAKQIRSEEKSRVVRTLPFPKLVSVARTLTKDSGRVNLQDDGHPPEDRRHVISVLC